MTGQGTEAGGWFRLTALALTAVVVGFSSTVLLVMDAARATGATPDQQTSWVAALCFGMALTTGFLSFRYRMPIITAWSTPGAALIATSVAGASFAEALGAFLAAGLLMIVAGLIKPLERLIERIPPAVAAAMLAGVLLRYALGVPAAAVAIPTLILPLIVVFFALRLLWPLYAVPAIVVLGVVMAFWGHGFDAACCGPQMGRLVWTTPAFSWSTFISLGIPLFLVTMASQNLPGFAVLRAAGYRPPVAQSLLVTGAASAALAPFGSHAINMAAITAAMVTGPDCHPDPDKRWRVAVPYVVIYALVGLLAGQFVSLFGGLPAPLITAIAGLALFAPLMGAMSAMLSTPEDIETALVTFLVTASGVSLLGVGSAFWGLVAGLVLYSARHFLRRK